MAALPWLASHTWVGILPSHHLPWLSYAKEWQGQGLLWKGAACRWQEKCLSTAGLGSSPPLVSSLDPGDLGQSLRALVLSSIKMGTFGASEMAQRVKMLASKTGNVSSIPTR